MNWIKSHKKLLMISASSVIGLYFFIKWYLGRQQAQQQAASTDATNSADYQAMLNALQAQGLGSAAAGSITSQSQPQSTGSASLQSTSLPDLQSLEKVANANTTPQSSAPFSLPAEAYMTPTTTPQGIGSGAPGALDAQGGTSDATIAALLALLSGNNQGPQPGISGTGTPPPGVSAPPTLSNPFPQAEITPVSAPPSPNFSTAVTSSKRPSRGLVASGVTPSGGRGSSAPSGFGGGVRPQPVRGGIAPSGPVTNPSGVQPRSVRTPVMLPQPATPVLTVAPHGGGRRLTQVLPSRG